MKKLKMVFIVSSMIFIFLGMLLNEKILDGLNDIYASRIILGLEVIAKEDVDEIIRNHNQGNIEEVFFFFFFFFFFFLQGYLISQNMDVESYDGIVSISANDCNIYICEPEMSKSELIQSNTPLQVLLVGEEIYEYCEIYLSGLPIIQIDSQDETMTLYNIFGEVEQYESTYHIRGATSSGWPKNSYKVEINESESLLGMREDDDWILNPLYMDSSKMREKIGYDIWNDMSDINNHTMEYVEVIIDDTYLGLYALQEPVDHKTFNLDKEEDYFYSIKAHNDGVRISADTSIQEVDGKYMLGIYELEDVTEFTEVEYVKVLSSIDSWFNNEEGVYTINYNQDNFLDYAVFINLVTAADNRFKNQKLAVELENGIYTLSKTPWDLDISMDNTQYPTEWWDNIVECTDSARNRTLFSTEEMFELEAEAYWEIRNEFYDQEYIQKKVEEYSAKLMNSGAIARDAVLWDNNNFEEDVIYITEFLINQMEFLDEYYGDVDGI